MDSISNVSFRIDSELKKQADELFASLGLNLTTAFNMFLRQCVREGRIPFEVTTRVPNKDTIEALIEALKIANQENVKTYEVVEGLEKLKS